MQWIKATDRQPEDWNKVHARNYNTKEKAFYLHTQGDYPIFSNHLLGEIEWLDENTDPVIYVASADYGIPWGETHKHILYVGTNQDEAVKSISNLSRKPDKEGNRLEGVEIQVWINGKCEKFRHGGEMKKK